MIKRLKNFLVDMTFVVIFLSLSLIIFSQCEKKEYPPSNIQQPAQTNHPKEKTDIFREGRKHTEFWNMMIPAL